MCYSVMAMSKNAPRTRIRYFSAIGKTYRTGIRWALAATMVLTAGCMPHATVASAQLRIVPNQAPIGTKIDLPEEKLANSRWVLMLVSSCRSCSSQILHLAKHRHDLTRVIVVDDPALVGSLQKEWPGIRIIADTNGTILPDYSYGVTPQMFLVEGGAIADEAIGAIDCASKWDMWNP